MSFKIRRAEKRDIEKILELLEQVDMVHHNGRPDIFKGSATKYNAEELREILDDDSTPVFVCVGDDDVPVGHAFCVQKQENDNSVLTDIKTLYIDDICVDESTRGCHAGKTLYEYVENYALQNGFYNITLNVWSCNPSAVKFYEAMGLVPQKIGMEKVISNSHQ